MLKKFTDAITDSFKEEKAITENGAIAYKTSGTELVDFNFKMSSYRNLKDDEIIKDFIGVYNENPINAVKMVFFTGDIRQGMGERRVFNVCLNWLAKVHSEIIDCIIEFIPEYNRWDSVVNLFFIEETKETAFNIIKKQINEDLKNMEENKSVSLLAKWMPSINTSCKETVMRANIISKALGMSPKTYRKTLSSLRKYLDVVEVKMSSNNWKEIVYSNVPSKANLVYKEAFLRNDEQRRKEYIDSLTKGKEKINSSVAFPYDIVHKYGSSSYIRKRDEILEQMWKSLPDYVNGRGSDTICVLDGSGSMCSIVGKTNITCMEVARSIAIYFSEKMSGEFNNKFITFSAHPKLISFNKNWGLYEKLTECDRHDECSNTNIEAVFDLILNTAIKNNLKNDELPKNILILSDMEFDSAIDINGKWGFGSNEIFNSELKTLFEIITERFERSGYKMPKLVFWNICSRTNTVPIQENENGVILVSGFSPSIASIVFSNKLNPYDALMDKLNSKRYEAIEEAIKKLF